MNCGWHGASAVRGSEACGSAYPRPGRMQPWPGPCIGGGGSPTLSRTSESAIGRRCTRDSVPHVTPHAARHTFISTMRASGWWAGRSRGAGVEVTTTRLASAVPERSRNGACECSGLARTRPGPRRSPGSRSHAAMVRARPRSTGRSGRRQARGHTDVREAVRMSYVACALPLCYTPTRFVRGSRRAARLPRGGETTHHL